MTLMERRRALMGKSDSDSTIYGSKLTWAVGNVDSTTGEINPSYPTYISSGFVEVEGGKVLTYTGPDKDENDIAFYVYVGQYDENHDFISRITLYAVSSHIVTAQLVENCKYIRVQFGHSASSSVNMNMSDCSLFVCTVQDRSKVKNGFAPGSYTNGQTSASLTGNNLTIATFVNGYSNKLVLSFKYPLNMKVGDTVRVLAKKISGTMSRVTFAHIYVGGNEVARNKSWKNEKTAIDVSKTLQTANNTVYFTIETLSTQPTYANYTMSITVYINGVQALPEV